MPDPSGDLVLPAGRGLPRGLTIPAGELVERFSRSSGPGGQSVNTADSRVELRFDVSRSTALTDLQRARALTALAGRTVHGTVSITSSEHRSQLQNRVAARARLAALLAHALAPPPAARRATKPTRGSRERRLDSKRRRATTKRDRGRVVDP
jgi:ribosome-associated protein